MSRGQSVRRYSRGRCGYDITGQRFGLLVVLGPTRDANDRLVWQYRCDCGTEKVACFSDLRLGKVTSCECLKRSAERARKLSVARTTHGHSGRRPGGATPTYVTWASMHTRCYNPADVDHYPDYGGRGIIICERWRESYEAFLEDMGPRPQGTTIDRIDNDRGYSCGKCADCLARGETANCRWATTSEQQQNRRSNVFLEHAGRRQCIADWARELHVHRALITRRLRLGWTVADAVSTPPVAAKLRRGWPARRGDHAAAASASA